MLVFSKNKYISACLKDTGSVPPNDFWVNDFDGKEVKSIGDSNYMQVGGNSYLAEVEWVAEVDDRYLGG